MKNMVHKVRTFFAAQWHSLALLAAALGILFGVYLFRLGQLTNGRFSSSEVDVHNTYHSLHAILNNPVDGPYKFLYTILTRIYPHSIISARFTSVLFTILVCALFTIITYRWHGKRTALFATPLFGTSGWLLHLGRLGTSSIVLVLIPLALLLLASWVNTTERHGFALFYMTLLSGLAFYTPGAIWFLLLGSFFIRKAIFNHIRHARMWEKVGYIVAVIGFAAILGHAIYVHTNLLRTWLFIPTSLPTPIGFVRHWIDTIVYLFFRGPSAPSYWLGHTPMLDAFTAIMTIVGAYFYLVHYKNLRTRVIFGFGILGSLLVGLNGAPAMGYIVPIAYLLAATGITYLLHKWLTVFPRNPVARGVGYTIITAVVGLAVIYHLTSYFVAWRYDPSTVTLYSYKP